ncbi:unnamed protein product, partial [Nesidiocoris tenuis]
MRVKMDDVGAKRTGPQVVQGRQRFLELVHTAAAIDSKRKSRKAVNMLGCLNIQSFSIVLEP